MVFKPDTPRTITKQRRPPPVEEVVPIDEYHIVRVMLEIPIDSNKPEAITVVVAFGTSTGPNLEDFEAAGQREYRIDEPTLRLPKSFKAKIWRELQRLTMRLPDEDASKIPPGSVEANGG